MRLRYNILILFLIFLSYWTDNYNQSNSVIVSWSPNCEPDLTGYKVYYGKASRQYDRCIVLKGNQTECRIDGLTPNNRWYFAVTAFDDSGNESDFSREVSIYIPEDNQIDTMKVKIDKECYNFPNPFDPETKVTTIRYYLQEPGFVNITIYDSKEKVVRHLLKKSFQQSGEQYISWNGKDDNYKLVENGVYFAVIVTDYYKQVIKIGVIR